MLVLLIDRRWCCWSTVVGARRNACGP